MKTTNRSLVDRLAAALEEHKRAKVYRPEDNPFVSHDVASMATAGLLKASDKHPARNMAQVDRDGDTMGHELEEARFEGLAQAKTDKSLKRKATARARAARKLAFDEIVNSPSQPDEARMKQAWAVMAHLFPTVVRIAEGKRRWAGRYLGDVADDVAGNVLESMALMLAKSDQDLEVLEVAAEQIATQLKTKGGVPGDQLSEDEKAERKQIAKARKWLMQVTNNRVMDTMIDVYFRSHNLRWQNIDLVATIMANINGVGDDPMMSRFKADRAPAFMGFRFQRPGGIDPSLLATAINAAIAERGLDVMAELLLTNTRADGAFKWRKHAEDVFRSAPDGDGEWLWQAVVNATTGRNRDGKEWTMDRARKARGDAARQYVRNEFDWLPGFIVSVIEAFDQHMIGWSMQGPGGRPNAVMASDFELYYLPEEPEKRQPLRPVLKYATASEAAEALIEHMAALITGADMVRGVNDA